jgi:ribosomal protein S2
MEKRNERDERDRDRDENTTDKRTVLQTLEREANQNLPGMRRILQHPDVLVVGDVLQLRLTFRKG